MRKIWVEEMAAVSERQVAPQSHSSSSKHREDPLPFPRPGPLPGHCTDLPGHPVPALSFPWWSGLLSSTDIPPLLSAGLSSPEAPSPLFVPRSQEYFWTFSLAKRDHHHFQRRGHPKRQALCHLWTVGVLNMTLCCGFKVKTVSGTHIVKESYVQWSVELIWLGHLQILALKSFI